MKIAFFTDTYLPNRDGVVTAILNYRAELERRGHEVHIFSPGSRQAKRENRDRRVFLYTSAGFKPYPDYKIAIFPFFSSSKVRELGIDVVHSHGLATMGLAAYAAARREGLPALESFHTLLPEAAHYISRNAVMRKLTGRVAWRYLKWYLGLYKTVTAPSEYTRSQLASHGIRSELAPNPVDTKRFRPGIGAGGFRAAHGLEARTVFMHVGRLVLEKNIDLLIDSALLVKEEVPDAVFAVVGAGPAKEYYMRRVREKGLERLFVFTGFLPDDELPKAYSACDVLAFPSRFETQGLVALEAMACGKPVACAAHSATSELVEEGRNGFSFASNADDCAEKLVLAAHSARRMGRAARKRAEAYSLAKCTDRLLSIYRGMG